MSFLLDPPLLVAGGVAIETLVPEEQRDLAEAATIVTFLGISIALYLNAPGLGLFWKPFRARNGRDFMWRSGIPRFGSGEVGRRSHLVAAAIFATYPLWLRFGRWLGAPAQAT